MDAVRNVRNDVWFCGFLLLVAVEEMVMAKPYKIPANVAVALSTSRTEFLKMQEKEDPQHKDLYRLLADLIDDRLKSTRKLSDFECKLRNAHVQLNSAMTAMDDLFNTLTGHE